MASQTAEPKLKDGSVYHERWWAGVARLIPESLPRPGDQVTPSPRCLRTSDSPHTTATQRPFFNSC